MNELKAKLTAHGLSDEMATKVIHTVADFVKSKLPDSMHGLIDKYLGDDAPNADGTPADSESGGLGGILGSLGGLGSLFGGK
jgi:hypothetical protein